MEGLSIALAVVQFVDFTSKLVSATWKIHSGEPSPGGERSSHLKTITEDLTKYNDSLRQSQLAPISGDAALLDLAGKCNNIGSRLVDTLNSLQKQKGSAHGRVWGSLRLALREKWHENDIKAMSEDLQNYRQQVILHLIASQLEITTTMDHEIKKEISNTNKGQLQAIQSLQIGLDKINGKLDSLSIAQNPYRSGIMIALPPSQIHQALRGKDTTSTCQHIIDKLNYLEQNNRVLDIMLFGEITWKTELWTWSREELTKAFNNLIEEVSKTCNIMIFIDGMDEFCGDLLDVIEFVQGLCRTPGVKVCASSRPWNRFRDSFEHQPHLQVERLTYNDIHEYVDSKLRASATFQGYESSHPGFPASLIKDVCDKADGVFLWVRLVVSSLFDGLMDGENPNELREHLEEIPNELEMLFEKILWQPDPKHPKNLVREHLIDFGARFEKDKHRLKHLLEELGTNRPSLSEKIVAILSPETPSKASGKKKAHTSETAVVDSKMESKTPKKKRLLVRSMVGTIRNPGRK
ncbi:hypothetical protein E8E13_002973 [Curvularia kusanoi]|uniref:Uncharacterized protein n=1 Tax=Curvularia kusanoi TaxID=90978 RepID=A0A9P4T6B0_CURKU|nr:hypothetical protein E8E13_002973 [Curvularia kusanoi]